MNPAEVATALLIEQTLSQSHAYRKIDDSLYTVKQGSCYVMINIVPWNDDQALVRCVAQLVRGVRMDGRLAQQLLELNAHMRFGAFAYEPEGQLVLFIHSILGGATLDREELVATVRDVALVADEYDDRIVAKYGGQTMKDLLEEAALEKILEKDPEAFRFEDDA
ncbi:MAG TPA: YbjN domain-containing protein [Haliangiales bacterium]|nr:YbjN domain-containing protein [Haliangiales bacterium]